MVVLRIGEQVGFRLYDETRLLQRSPDDVRFNPMQFPVVMVRSTDVVRDAEDAAGLEGLFNAEQYFQGRDLARFVVMVVVEVVAPEGQVQFPFQAQVVVLHDVQHHVGQTVVRQPFIHGALVVTVGIVVQHPLPVMGIDLAFGTDRRGQHLGGVTGGGAHVHHRHARFQAEEPEGLEGFSGLVPADVPPVPVGRFLLLFDALLHLRIFISPRMRDKARKHYKKY